ncbi:hypothetical protein B0H19DRAFT_948515 [Mycena capillaripes]|nr:hypothetical protein B0H19DRAFT_948515 [Mycena capillaripes]
MGSLSKIPFLLATAIFYDQAFSSPNPPASPEEQKRTKTSPQQPITWYERLMAFPILQIWIRTMYWAFALTEAVAVLGFLPAPAPAILQPSGSGITPTFVLGAVLIIGGASIRFHCYRELGRHFTFALSLRDNHRLITTGPYAIVRHPSYAGGNMTLLGAVLTLLCDGSWWFCGGCATVWGRVLAVAFIAATVLYVPAYVRGAKEDAYLRRFFGTEWERYAQRVQYGYIPGIC